MNKVQVPRSQLGELATLLRREKESLDALLASFQDAESETLRILLEKVLQEGEAVRRFAEAGGHPQPETTASSEESLAFEAIEKAIEESRALLNLEDDWDDQGGVGYSPATWERAASFLRMQVRAGLESNGTPIPVPRILPGPDGSIDLHWKAQSFELLVNVQSGNGGHASFYGDDYGKLTIEGTINTEVANDGLLAWLMKAQDDGLSRAFPTATASS